jgi:hypothetical protein
MMTSNYLGNEQAVREAVVDTPVAIEEERQQAADNNPNDDGGLTSSYSHGFFDTKGKKAALGASIGAVVGVGVGILLEEIASAFFKAALTALAITNPIIGIALLAAITAIVVGVLTYNLSSSDNLSSSEPQNRV